MLYLNLTLALCECHENKLEPGTFCCIPALLCLAVVAYKMQKPFIFLYHIHETNHVYTFVPKKLWNYNFLIQPLCLLFCFVVFCYCFLFCTLTLCLLEFFKQLSKVIYNFFPLTLATAVYLPHKCSCFFISNPSLWFTALER